MVTISIPMASTRQEILNGHSAIALSTLHRQLLFYGIQSWGTTTVMEETPRLRLITRRMHVGPFPIISIGGYGRSKDPIRHCGLPSSTLCPDAESGPGHIDATLYPDQIKYSSTSLRFSGSKIRLPQVTADVLLTAGHNHIYTRTRSMTKLRPNALTPC